MYDSTTLYSKTQKRPNTEPHGIPEALDRTLRQQIASRVFAEEILGVFADEFVGDFAAIMHEFGVDYA